MFSWLLNMTLNHYLFLNFYLLFTHIETRYSKLKKCDVLMQIIQKISFCFWSILWKQIWYNLCKMANSQIIVRTLTFALTAVAALFAVLATAGNYWINENNFGHAGLWKGCSLVGCYEMGNGNGTYKIYILTWVFSIIMKQFSLKTLGVCTINIIWVRTNGFS